MYGRSSPAHHPGVLLSFELSELLIPNHNAGNCSVYSKIGNSMLSQIDRNQFAFDLSGCDFFIFPITW